MTLITVLEDYWLGLEADRILRETKPDDWVSFSELTEYREQARRNGEIETDESFY
jgi:hypothetical protein